MLPVCVRTSEASERGPLSRRVELRGSRGALPVGITGHALWDGAHYDRTNAKAPMSWQLTGATGNVARFLACRASDLARVGSLAWNDADF